eukprot:6973204-Pyramimonas_sp.AAC.1
MYLSTRELTNEERRGSGDGECVGRAVVRDGDGERVGRDDRLQFNLVVVLGDQAYGEAGVGRGALRPGGAQPGPSVPAGVGVRQGPAVRRPAGHRAALPPQPKRGRGGGRLVVAPHPLEAQGGQVCVTSHVNPRSRLSASQWQGLSAGNIRRIFDGIFEMPCAEWYISADSRRLST